MRVPSCTDRRLSVNAETADIVPYSIFQKIIYHLKRRLSMVYQKKLEQFNGFQLTDIRVYDIDHAVEIHIRQSDLCTVEL